MNPQTIKVACSNCNLRELCMPMGLSDQDLNRLDDLVAVRRKVKRGTTLFTNGEKFTSLYAIRTGFFKTCLATEDGRDQVTGFQMASCTISTAAMRWPWKMPKSVSCRLTGSRKFPAR